KEFNKDGLEILGVTTYYEAFGFDKDKGQLKQVGKFDPATKKVEGGLKPAEEHDMLKDFVGHHKLKHRIMTMSQSNWTKAGTAYGVSGIPHAALIDRKGIVRMVRVGASPDNTEDLHTEIKKLIAEK